MRVQGLAAFADNWIWLWRDEATGTTGVVDPGEAEPVLRALRGGPLHHILLTHHHADHIGGVEELVARTGARVWGLGADRHRLPPLDHPLEAGQDARIGGLRARVLHLPAHTLGHIAFHLPEPGLLFCGDALFLMGCGRLFEGDGAALWTAMRTLRSLPDATLVCCAHEYTRANAHFVHSILPGDEEIHRRLAEVEALTARGAPTVPAPLGRERRTNLFLRADAPIVARALGMEGADPVAVATALRRRRDVFQAPPATPLTRDRAEPVVIFPDKR